MMREMPLLSGWTLTADELDEKNFRRREGFSLPGADELRAFAGLLEMEEEEAAFQDAACEASFSLPGMLSSAAKGRACLSREIDFGRLSGDWARLQIDHLCGSGQIELGQQMLCRFGVGQASAQLDLSDALRLGRKQTLRIRFDDAQQAGVCGAVLLKTTAAACFEEIELLPDAAHQTLTTQIRCSFLRPGEYAIRLACVPDIENAAAPWQESRFYQAQAGEAKFLLTLSMRANRFKAGEAYDAPVIKFKLYAFDGEKDKRGVLLDAKTQMTGYGAAAPLAYLPLTAQECTMNPDDLFADIKRLNVHALFLPGPVSEFFCRRATFEGIALMAYLPHGTDAAAYPCVFPVQKPDVRAFDPPTPAAACVQLCGMPAAPTMPDGTAAEHELLKEAAGRELDAHEPETALRIKKLRALQVRLCAEAARQGQYTGALCAPGEWRAPEIFEALRTAFSALHLSVLPLRGAWWTQAFFSATLKAFIPPDMEKGTYAVQAALVDESGTELLSFCRDTGVRSGMLGVMQGRLPDHACVLTLRTRLLRSGAVVESQEMPVYVGERGPLEAAFA